MGPGTRQKTTQRRRRVPRLDPRRNGFRAADVLLSAKGWTPLTKNWSLNRGTQLFSDPGKKGTLLGKTIFSGAATKRKGKKGATEQLREATSIRPKQPNWNLNGATWQPKKIYPGHRFSGSTFGVSPRNPHQLDWLPGSLPTSQTRSVLWSYRLGPPQQRLP